MIHIKREVPHIKLHVLSHTWHRIAIYWSSPAAQIMMTEGVRIHMKIVVVLVVVKKYFMIDNSSITARKERI